MANSYTAFSFQVSCPSEEAAKFLVESMVEAMENEDEDCWLTLEHLEPRGKEVWIADEEGGTNLDSLVDILQAYLKHSDPGGSIGFSWANTCSKLRVDEFGGGAVFITHDNQTWLSTDHWLSIQESNRANAAHQQEIAT